MKWKMEQNYVNTVRVRYQKMRRSARIAENQDMGLAEIFADAGGFKQCHGSVSSLLSAEIIQFLFGPAEQQGQCAHEYQEEDRRGEQRPDQALCAVLLGHHDDLLVGDGVGKGGILDQRDHLVAHGGKESVPDEALTDEDEDILNYDDLDDPDAFV